jgi:hypothetical protein
MLTFDLVGQRCVGEFLWQIWFKMVRTQPFYYVIFVPSRYAHTDIISVVTNQVFAEINYENPYFRHSDGSVLTPDGDATLVNPKSTSLGRTAWIGVYHAGVERPASAVRESKKN